MGKKSTGLHRRGGEDDSSLCIFLPRDFGTHCTKPEYLSPAGRESSGCAMLQEALYRSGLEPFVPQRGVTANQYNIVQCDHLYSVMKYFCPNGSGLFQEEEEDLRATCLIVIPIIVEHQMRGYLLEKQRLLFQTTDANYRVNSSIDSCFILSIDKLISGIFSDKLNFPPNQWVLQYLL